MHPSLLVQLAGERMHWYPTSSRCVANSIKLLSKTWHSFVHASTSDTPQMDSQGFKMGNYRASPGTAGHRNAVTAAAQATAKFKSQARKQHDAVYMRYLWGLCLALRAKSPTVCHQSRTVQLNYLACRDSRFRCSSLSLKVTEYTCY